MELCGTEVGNMSGCHTHHSAAGMMYFALPWFPQQNADGIFQLDFELPQKIICMANAIL